jgi:hypothetical protein
MDESLGAHLRTACRLAPEGKVAHRVQIKNIFSIHEEDLAAFSGIKLATKPAASLLGNFTTGHDERMVYQYLPARLGIEDLVT